MATFAYRLSLAPDLLPFLQEIEHTLAFVDEAYGLDRRADASVVLHYGANPPTGAIGVPAVLFPNCVETGADGIRPRRAVLGQMLSSVKGLLPGNRRPIGSRPDYDAIGLIFLMLSRMEERDHPERDRYQRFPLSAALIQPEDGRLYPWADHAARDIAAALTGNPAPKSYTRYSVLFTHDVDMLKGYHRPLDPLRLFAGDVVRGRRGLIEAGMRLHTAYLGGEPFWCARRMMDLSERHGILSHFYFMGPSVNRMDSPYVVSMTDTLCKLAGEIDARGHVIGFHPGFMTATDPAEWQRQRSGLESAIGRRVTEGRQHVLRYDTTITPRIWSDAGMTLDSTLAYPEVVGFRNGTCRPVRAYDLVARRTLPLRQVSTQVMEFGLFGGKYRELTDAQAAADAAWARDLCREHGGTFTLLFHTSNRDERLWRWFDAVLTEAAA